VLKIIGPGINNRDLGYNDVIISNYNNTQLLSMIFHPGDLQNEFREFIVIYKKEELESTYKINTPFFGSGKGIKLGMNKKQLKRILGSPSKIINENNSIIWLYEDSQSLYFGRYYFKNALASVKPWFGAN
jgi:hypothetical protein